MDVRPCSETDLARLRERWPSPPGTDVHGWHHSTQRTDGTTYLVAWEGDEPLGSAVVQNDGACGVNARAAFPDHVETNHLQVRPQRRGRGVGTALVSAAEDVMRSRGASAAAVSVDQDNVGARRLYERLGYRPTGVFDVCSYEWFDDRGGVHLETEHYEVLVKPLE